MAGVIERVTVGQSGMWLPTAWLGRSSHHHIAVLQDRVCEPVEYPESYLEPVNQLGAPNWQLVEQASGNRGGGCDSCIVSHMALPRRLQRKLMHQTTSTRSPRETVRKPGS